MILHCKVCRRYKAGLHDYSATVIDGTCKSCRELERMNNSPNKRITTLASRDKFRRVERMLGMKSAAS